MVSPYVGGAKISDSPPKKLEAPSDTPAKKDGFSAGGAYEDDSREIASHDTTDRSAPARTPILNPGLINELAESKAATVPAADRLEKLGRLGLNEFPIPRLELVNGIDTDEGVLYGATAG